MTNSARQISSLILTALALVLFGCSSLTRHPGAQEPYECFQDISYGDLNANKYDLFIPARKPQGAILFIHGGAWVTGDKQDMHAACNNYAAKGFLTASMNYSLGSLEHPVACNQMLDEITACLQHLKAEAARHGIKLKRIAISGYSAGGHLTMLYAYTKAAVSPLKIAFVVPMVGPTTFEPGTWRGLELKLFPLFVMLAGCGNLMADDFQPENLQKIIKSLSPAQNVNKKTVPTICAFGQKDDLVQYIQAEKLVEQLRKYNVPHVLISFPNSGHGLDKDPDCTLKLEETVQEYADKYF